jgi:DinB superfamily
MLTIDFAAIRAGKATYADQISHISYKDLRPYTDEAFEAVRSSISSATDAVVTFVPRDPQSTEDDERGWTLAHVITHLTAVLEGAAAIASVLARGVQIENGLSLHYETPWEEIQTIQQVQVRLTESQRICHAYLDTWPDQPHLDITVTRSPLFGPTNAIGKYAFAIGHAYMHCEQLREIIRQAQTDLGPLS